MEKISVLMSVYKEPIEWIKMAVDSIVKQTYKNIEIIIIVDSPDYNELIEVLREYENKHKYIRLLINQENIGLVKSLNKGLDFCTGEYIARMDADDICEPQRLERQMLYLKEKNYDLVGCAYSIFSGNTEIRKHFGPASHDICKKMLRYRSCILHPAWLVRKQVYETLNGYRNFDACEDLDFLIRASLAGFKLGNVQSILMGYRDNPNSISHLKLFRQHAIRNLITNAYKKKCEVSYESYESYLKSEKYKKDVEQLQRINEKEHILKSSKANKINRILMLFQLIFNRYYLNEKVENQALKILGKLGQ